MQSTKCFLCGNQVQNHLIVISVSDKNLENFDIKGIDSQTGMNESSKSNIEWLWWKLKVLLSMFKEMTKLRTIASHHCCNLMFDMRGRETW